MGSLVLLESWINEIEFGYPQLYEIAALKLKRLKSWN